jgi:hypothetical protein
MKKSGCPANRRQRRTIGSHQGARRDAVDRTWGPTVLYHPDIRGILATALF